MLNFNLGFIGAGNMARAIGISLVKNGLLKPNQVIVSSPEAAHLEVWKSHGCQTTFQNGDVINSSELVLWSVKPQIFPIALKDTAVDTNTKSLSNLFHISIMAGVPLTRFSGLLEQHFKTAVRAARIMPNIGMKVGAGVSVYTLGQNATETDKTKLEQVLSPLGLSIEVPESQINAYCGLFGSGIGFMFPIMEGLADGGVKMGVPRDLSLRIAAQTMKGAAELMLDAIEKEEQMHPGAFKDSVCSPGGTTIEGIATLERLGVRSAMMQAVEAATTRGDELGKVEE